MFKIHKDLEIGVCIFPKINKNVLIDDIENMIFIKGNVTKNGRIDNTSIGVYEIPYDHFEKHLTFIKSCV